MDPNIPTQPVQNEIPPFQPNPLSQPVVQQPVTQQPPIQQQPINQIPSSENKWKLILIIIILLVIVGGGIYYLGIRQNKLDQQKTITTTITQSTLTSTPTPISPTIPISTSGTQTTQTQSSFTCGNTVSFNYDGSRVTYGTVLSQGQCWMDRNLGASRVASSVTDSNAYGDLFQWGRPADGHQLRTSGTTTTLSSTDVPRNSNFIYGMGSPYDWRSPQNKSLWQGVSGINNPCPLGWAIPTGTQWTTEYSSWSQQNSNGAFASPLKLTVGGDRYDLNAAIVSVGRSASYWSSTINDGIYADFLSFSSDNVLINNFDRAFGFSVRCVQN